MADFNSLYQQGLYLSPGEQDLLLAALSSNNPPSKQQSNAQKPKSASKPNHTPGQASSAGSFSASPAFDGSNSQLGNMNYDESPFLDLNPDLDWDFQDSENLIGDLPESAESEEHEGGEKRKEMDSDSEMVGKKRRESAAKKPGRKPLTSEPTSKRKAQNRAAQRAFRERKERHLKDLETKVDELQKVSDDTNEQNGLLKAQVERLQVELREYRKRLSWVTHGNALSAINSYPGNANRLSGLNNNEFAFDFPKFGDLPGGRIFSGGPLAKSGQNIPKDDTQIPGVLRHPVQTSAPGRTSTSASPKEAAPGRSAHTSPSANGLTQNHIQNLSAYNYRQPVAGHDTSNSDSPSSSSDSHQFLSSSGTSPEPSLQSPVTKHKDSSDEHHHSCGIDGEASFCAQLGMACGNIKNPVPVVRHHSESATNTPDQPGHTENTENNENTDNFPGLDFLAQQNGGQFDPLLFGDWREPQDAILSQDFNTFFDDAFPLPDLGSPSHNLTEAGPSGPSAQPRKSILDQIDSRMDEEVVPGEDKAKMLSCNKIWDRLQSMEKFRNGEIDVDNLCSELRTKARCSEGGVVVNQTDVDDIIGRV
ncbi:transcription factor PAP1-domain-containing protein [Aspergillus cavernicola]|uniref:Transcription factor PAP1-domain-containing protein n=1 Tax=Aspergillus cavernicola TaxID=176166 RepID=A0ABR4HHV0_9EURO